MEPNFPADFTWQHQMPAQLRFSDVDPFGHVNNAVYFSLFDMCKTKYFLDVIGDDVFKQMGIVVANVSANFLAPIFYPDEIVIQTSITRLGNKSFTLCQRALNIRTQSIKCECRTIMVAFDYQKNESIRMPQAIREKIAAFEKNPALLESAK
ncbi:MAG: acyl-CoA thioesterase [Bacteroidaceae bacterium]|nr:acyl-CoA thioesterase [Bacteroidaceae bacterium]